MARARNHIHVLEENMALLMEQAIANEGLFYRLLYLQRSLTAASNDDTPMRFHRWARDLGLAGASLRLFPDRWRLGAPSNHTHLALSRQSFEPLRIQRLGQEQHCILGRLTDQSCWWCYRKRKRWDRWRCRCWEAMLIWVSCCLPVAMPVTINKGKRQN